MMAAIKMDIQSILENKDMVLTEAAVIEALSKEDAVKFHIWQVEQLANAGVDFLFAATMPAVSEAAGIAVAMAKTDTPYIISFVINKDGSILDGSSLEQAFNEIEAACRRPPLGFMINCAYPSFLNAHKQPASVLARLIGFQANASSLDHAQLDGTAGRQADDISDWGDRMIGLNKKFGVKILGGCCGTRCEHQRKSRAVGDIMRCYDVSSVGGPGFNGEHHVF
jgi:S-methylmethionine-dependent homocysteine/selenocysteine methylase